MSLIKIDPRNPAPLLGKTVCVNWEIPSQEWTLKNIWGSKAQVENKFGELKIVSVHDVYLKI